MASPLGVFANWRNGNRVPSMEACEFVNLEKFTGIKIQSLPDPKIEGI